jgi:hypothetical protein
MNPTPEIGVSKAKLGRSKKTQMADRPNSPVRCRGGATQTDSPPHAGVGEPLEIGPPLWRDRFQPVGVA